MLVRVLQHTACGSLAISRVHAACVRGRSALNCPYATYRCLCVWRLVTSPPLTHSFGLSFRRRKLCWKRADWLAASAENKDKENLAARLSDMSSRLSGASTVRGSDVSFAAAASARCPHASFHTFTARAPAEMRHGCAMRPRMTSVPAGPAKYTKTLWKLKTRRMPVSPRACSSGSVLPTPMLLLHLPYSILHVFCLPDPTDAQ